MRRIVFMVAAVALLTLTLLGLPSDPQVAEEVIAVTKAQWAAEMRKDTAAAMKNVAEEYTQFDSDYPTCLEGKAINQRIGEANAGGSGSLVAAEMANEKVQVYGDVAILSYNFIGVAKDKDGEVEPIRAKSTRVYVKKGGQWWLVHANFGEAH